MDGIKTTIEFLRDESQHLVESGDPVTAARGRHSFALAVGLLTVIDGVNALASGVHPAEGDVIDRLQAAEAKSASLAQALLDMGSQLEAARVRIGVLEAANAAEAAAVISLGPTLPPAATPAAPVVAADPAPVPEDTTSALPPLPENAPVKSQVAPEPPPVDIVVEGSMVPGTGPAVATET